MPPPGPRALGSIDARASVLPGGNTRSVLFYTPFPTAMARGEGCFLEDVDDHRYVDFCGEYTAGLFGHSEPRIQAALHAAIDRGLNLASVGEREGQLAALLCARFPSLERVRFTNSGTEANMMALGAARTFCGRPGILAFRGGYHGGLLTLVGGGSPINAPLPVTLADYNDTEQTIERSSHPCRGDRRRHPRAHDGLGRLHTGNPGVPGRAARRHPRGGHPPGLRRGDDQQAFLRRAAEAPRRNARPHHPWQVHGRRHELWRFRRARRRDGPLRWPPSRRPHPFRHLQQQRDDDGRRPGRHGRDLRRRRGRGAVCARRAPARAD